jgi:hypothetical protein
MHGTEDRHETTIYGKELDDLNRREQIHALGDPTVPLKDQWELREHYQPEPMEDEKY